MGLMILSCIAAIIFIVVGMSGSHAGEKSVPAEKPAATETADASSKTMSKDEVRQWPVIGWFASRAGTLFIRRGGGQASAISSAIGERLAQNGLLTLFPEGTTTDGREVRPFFSRLFAAAIETGTPIAPVAIRYHIEGEFDPLAPYIDEQSLGENLLSLLQRRRSQVHVHFAEPVHERDANRKGLAEQTRRAIVASLRQSPPGREDEHKPQQGARQA